MFLLLYVFVCFCSFLVKLHSSALLTFCLVVTPHTVASPPTMVSAQQMAPGSSISVTWMLPTGGAQLIGYIVHYSGGADAGSVAVGPPATSVIINDRISDGRIYNITVEARSKHLSGESTLVQIKLGESNNCA